MEEYKYLIGKTLEKAREEFKNTKYFIFPDRIDDKWIVCTCDMNEYRNRVEVDNNVITAVTGIH